MKVQTTVMPWWAQAGLLVIGLAGTIIIEYIQMERERQHALGNEDYDDSEDE